MIFQPHIYTYNYSGEQYNETNCVSEGKYCATDPDNKGELDGRDVLLESLRQICIYKIKIDSYFDYMDLFNQSCITELTEECSVKLLRKIGVDKNDIQDCVNKSFTDKKDTLYQSENTILAADLKLQKNVKVKRIPSIYINHIIYEGTSSALDLLLSTCSGLHDSTLNCRNLELEEGDQFSIFTIVLISVLVYVICVLLLAVICRKMVKKKYENEFNKMVDKYVGEYTVLENSKL